MDTLLLVHSFFPMVWPWLRTRDYCVWRTERMDAYSALICRETLYDRFTLHSLDELSMHWNIALIMVGNM